MADQKSTGTAPPTNQADRRQLIRERVAAEGFVRSTELAADFGVSLMTVHRDLDTLQAEGWLRKMRGGATSLPSVDFQGTVAQRNDTEGELKRMLSAAALELVEPGQTIMLDDSTTCLPLAQQLPDRTPLTVISNFLPVISQLADQPGIEMIALGGTYYPAYQAFLGLATQEFIHSFRADLLFMSTTAITHGRCYHQAEDTIMVERAMMAASTRRILLADHTKFSTHGVYSLAPITDFDIVFVDAAVPAADLRRLRDLGVTVRVVRP